MRITETSTITCFLDIFLNSGVWRTETSSSFMRLRSNLNTKRARIIRITKDRTAMNTEVISQVLPSQAVPMVLSWASKMLMYRAA